MKIAAFAFLAALAPAALHANVAEDLLALVTTCERARSSGDTSAATVAAAEIAQFHGPFFNTKIEIRARDCLNEFAGGSWIYSYPHNRFVLEEFIEAERVLAEVRKEAVKEKERIIQQISIALAANAKKSLAALERLRVARTDLVISRTTIACVALYQRDEVGALTNPVCNEVFLAIGLPTN